MRFCLSLLSISIAACFCNVVADGLRESVVLMITVGAAESKDEPWSGQISVEDIVCASQVAIAIVGSTAKQEVSLFSDLNHPDYTCTRPRLK